MSNTASTSKESDFPLDVIESAISDIQTKMRINPISLKKLSATTSAKFITNEKRTVAHLNSFYLDMKDIETPDTEESERIALNITIGLENVNVAEALNYIKGELNKAKKEIDSYIKEIRSLFPIMEDLDNEVRDGRSRLAGVSMKQDDTFSRYDFALRELKREGDTSLGLASISQNFSRLREEMTGVDEGTHELVDSRTRVIQDVLDAAQQAHDELTDMIDQTSIEVTVDCNQTKGYSDNSPEDIMKDINELRENVKTFDLKMKTTDTKGKLIMKALRTYVADVKILIKHHTETAKAYKIALQEIRDLHLEVNNSITKSEYEKMRNIILITKYKKNDKKLNEIGGIIRECQETIEQNRITAGGTPKHRTIRF